MDRTLSELAGSDAPLAVRLRVVRALAAAAADLAARGKVHGGLAPDAVVALDGGGVVLRPAEPAPPLARAGFDAPEVARGGQPSRRSDAFSVGALAWLVLGGRAPFDARERVERVWRVLHREAEPVRLHAPLVPAEVDAAIAGLLERRAPRRGRAVDLVRAIDAALAPAGRPPRPAPLHRSAGARNSVRGPLADLLSGAGGSSRRRWPPALRPCTAAARRLPPAAARALRAVRTLPPIARTALVALPIVALSLAVLPRTDAALARRVGDLLARGDTAAARALLDDAARNRPGDPAIEKLRGDVACARGAPGECLRRYRVAFAAREPLREDPILRANARRLLDRGQSCGTRRAAAQLLGELRDPQALPALEEARRSGGLFAFFCTGHELDRAIAATRASAGR